MTDVIKQQLEAKSKKIASRIAKKTLEKKELEKTLNDYENSLTMLEAKVEVHREKRDELNAQLAKLKEEKNEYYAKRDKLIAEKRSLQTTLYDSVGDQPDIKNKLDELSNKIGSVIEESKAHTDKMQEIYEKAQEQHQLMNETNSEYHDEKYTSKNKILNYKKKLSDIDTELNSLRRKMREIKERLE